MKTQRVHTLWDPMYQYCVFIFCLMMVRFEPKHVAEFLILITIYIVVWEDNIRMDLQEVGLGYEDWIGLAQDRDRWRALVSAVRNLRVP